MGKSLKGKELGKGISQRKDGLYSGRFTNRNGKVVQKYFKKLADCRQWYADATFQDKHGSLSDIYELTLDAWYEYWYKNFKEPVLKPTSRIVVINGFKRIRPYFPKQILIKDIKQIHCQDAVNQMSSDEYASKTIRTSLTVLHNLFESAINNDIIIKNPCNSVVISHINDKPNIKYLTIDQQRKLLKDMPENHYKRGIAFVLQTGLRVSELNGLQWGDIDYKNRLMHIRRTLNHTTKEGWYFDTTKTVKGNRSIPLTEEAIKILDDVKKHRPKNIKIEFGNNIFLNLNGKPSRDNEYNRMMTNHCNKYKLMHVSMHMLRHTFATRCIEAGMKPKTLQTILGHANISMTMNFYVHTTDDEKQKEMNAIQSYLSVV